MMPTTKPTVNLLTFFAAIIGVFSVIFINNKWFLIFIDLLLNQTWVSPAVKSFFMERTRYDLVIQFISPIRGSILILSIGLMIMIILKDINWEVFRAVAWPGWRTAFFGFLVLVLLFFPNGLVGWANEYAETSLVMFSKIGNINNTERFLLPALAHILFFRGSLFYFIFSLMLNLLLMYVVLMWFARNGIPLAFWEFISLCTLSFISFNFYSPGYPDVLVHIFLLLALALPVGELGYLVFFTLSMATHEASLFVWAILTLFLFQKRTWIKFSLIVGTYFLFRFASYGFDAANAFSPQLVGELTPFEWVRHNIGRELLGIFFAFKVLWVIVLVTMANLIFLRKWRDFCFLASMVFVSVLITFFGIDTSRLAGWAFPAVLFSWKALSRDESLRNKQLFTLTKVTNLFIPSYYASLNIIVLPIGLYNMLIGLFH